MTLLDRLRAAPPGRQLIVGLLVIGLLVAAMTLLYVFVLRKDYAVLFRDLRTGDAATIVSELDKDKVPYRLDDGGTTILVPEDVVDSTRLGIMSRDLPLKGAVGFELFNKSDMGLTEFAQRINYQRALQGELARTIMTMDPVDSARVHLAMPEPTVFKADRRPPKASVTLLPRPGHVLTSSTVLGVQRLVAASIPELDISNVVVLDGKGQVVSGVPAQSAPTPVLDPAAQQRLAIEQYYAARVRQALEPLYPQGGLDVSVTAEAPAGAETENAFTTWSASARQFRLRVGVGVQPSPDPARQIEIRSLVETALDSASGPGDTVSVYASEMATITDTAVPTPPLAAASAPSKDPTAVPGSGGLSSPRGFWVSVFLATLLALATVAFGLHRRRQARPLSDDAKRAYSDRLRTLLDEGSDARAS